MRIKIFNFIYKHWYQLIPGIILVGLFVFIYGCQSTTQSLTQPSRTVTRSELQIEINTLLETSQIRFEDLDRQDQLRNLILQNALVVAQGQPFNPLGMISGLLAVYGAGSAARDTRNIIKKKKGTA